MKSRLLLDTHVLVRWLIEPHRLSVEQLRVLRQAAHRAEMVYVSAITLVELALLFRAGTSRIRSGPEVILQALESEDAFQILPLTTQIAREIPTVLPALKDPMDATIAATARVHGLRLVTSDQRILDSNVVSTVG